MTLRIANSLIHLAAALLILCLAKHAGLTREDDLWWLGKAAFMFSFGGAILPWMTGYYSKP